MEKIENKEVKKEESKKNILELNKESRILLFLKEINNNMSSEKVKELYLKKYNLSEKSNSINIRVIERFLGVYSKYSIEEKKIKVERLKEELKKVNINYNSLVEKLILVKEKNKRSNRINNFLEIENI